MNREELLYLLPYLISLALSLGIFVFTWRHRAVRGARTYAWFAAGQTLTIFGFLIELISPQLESKILWDKFQWLTTSFLVILPFLLFSVEFSDYQLRFPRLARGYWLGLPIAFTLVLLTDDIHHLLYPNPHLSAAVPFAELQYDFTFVVYVYALFYVYGANLFGLALLFRRARQKHNPQQFQYWTIAIGFLIPIALSIFALAGIYISSQRDLSPISLALGNLVVAWGLFRHRLFNLVPIARERVLENLTDSIIVVDASNRVVDINQVAMTNIGKTRAQVIGRSTEEVFDQWPELVDRVRDLDEAEFEIFADVLGERRTYDLRITPLRDTDGQLAGKVFVSRDISSRKSLEEGYRKLSEDLEQRVRERTEELRKSTERYRAVVENQTEFIVRWKADGMRTFANEAYCRYFGITQEQATSSSFLALVAAEDRPAIEAKIARLMSGSVKSETEIHRVIKPDGTIGWQEWVDQAIYDQDGVVIECQSVGRDVTLRVQAEEALRESEAIYRQAIEVAGAVPYRQTYATTRQPAHTDFVGAGIFNITGYQPEEFRVELWDTLVQEMHTLDELAGFSRDEAVRKVRSGELPVWKCEYRIRARDGTTRWVFESAVELRDEHGISFGSIGMFQDITEHKRAEERLRELTRRLVASQEEERKRIAQELHDELGQALTAISLDLGGIEKALPEGTNPALRERVADARTLADEVDERISELALDLRPSLLDDLGLLPTLKWYLNRYSQRLGIQVELDTKGLDDRLPGEVEVTLYRVIQEALTNIARHAQARSVRMSLDRREGGVRALIQDDGRGFDVREKQDAASVDGLGLLGIKDRVSTLGGRAEIQSFAGEGTRIDVEIPL